MGRKSLNYLFFLLGLLIFFVWLNCSSAPVDLSKKNPKLFKELIKDYYVADEENFGEAIVLKFQLDEKKSIIGKIDGIDIQNCTWFLDRKFKQKEEEDVASLKKINLNCAEKFFIVRLDASITQEKLNYKGKYTNQFNRLKKGLVLEGNCSITSVAKTGIEESSLEEKKSEVECFPYPHDLDRYTKERNREIIHGHFLYLDSLENLKAVFASSEDEEMNAKILESIEKEFNDEYKRKNQKTASSIIGRDFQLNLCEYIDFREIPIPNSRGIELQKKIDTLLESDLKNPANKEKLKEAIDDLFNCKEKCSSKEKEIIGLFEIKGKNNRAIILQKKFQNKNDILKFQRFQFYSVEGKLSYIDFSPKGEIEKLLLE